MSGKPEKRREQQLLSKESRERLAAEFEIGFYEKVLDTQPRHPGALQALGHAYTARGLYEKGLAIDVRLCDLHPRDPLAHYNLACSYSLVGDADRAIAALARAVELGYNDWRHLKEDRDLDRVREDPRFKDLLERHA